MNLIRKLRKLIAPIIFILIPLTQLLAQGKLDEKLSIAVHQKSLSQTLGEIARKGGFYFSYNTNIIRGDSLISIKVVDKTVRQILDGLLGGSYEYMESGGYIIILQKTTSPPARVYTVSGIVKDGNTKEKLSNVSIYESDQLVSALTDTNGFFRLKLKEKYSVATLIISKQLYKDTLLFVQPGRDQQLTVSINHAQIDELSPFVVTNRVEKTWLGKFFLSSRQVVQSMNLLDFFAKKQIQFSLTPGLGTHGRMGSQVVNKFSLNAIGGYTAGVNGLELAGLFNIDIKEVKYVQVAGVFNIVGGSVRGIQIAGIHNHDLDSVHGCQVGGISNVVMGSLSGVQISGLFNHVEHSMKGVQAAGLVNLSRDSISGVQIAGWSNHVKNNMHGVQVAGVANRVGGKTSGLQIATYANFSKTEMNGVQISTFLNKTHKLKGVQIALVNVADSSDGYMIGLVNIVKKGVHELSLSSNEMLPVNLSYKAGSRKIYSIFLAGLSTGTNNKAYSFGFGIGNDLRLSARMSLVDELYMQHFYLGDWKKEPVVFRYQPSLRVMVAKKLSFFAGPAFSFYSPHPLHPVEGYKVLLPAPGYHTFAMGNCIGWLGWTVGVNFF